MFRVMTLLLGLLTPLASWAQVHPEVIPLSLSCEKSPDRLREIRSYDAKLFSPYFLDSAPAEVPADILQIFNLLTTKADQHVPSPFGPRVWTLSGYQSSVVNAHAGSNGEVIISSAFWDENSNFSTKEVAAILGHEITHVVHRDSLKLGCLAFEKVGMEDIPLTLEELTTIFNDPLADASWTEAWSEMSQAQEYAADKGSQRLLQLAGLNPGLMAKVLRKLSQQVSEGHSGSHPDFENRIKALRPQKRLP